MTPRFLIPILSCVWLCVCLMGAYALLSYSYGSGFRGEVLDVWPKEAEQLRAKNERQLVVALHPHCPCSWATVHELERIIAAAKSPPAVTVLAVYPEDQPGWLGSKLLQESARVLGGRILPDPDGKIASLFGAETSGDIRLYDQKGYLAFTGGVTSMRAHEGRSVSGTVLIDKLNGSNQECSPFTVYGCPLSGEAD